MGEIIHMWFLEKANSALWFNDIIMMTVCPCVFWQKYEENLKCCTNLSYGYIRTYTIKLLQLTGLQAGGSKNITQKYIG